MREFGILAVSKQLLRQLFARDFAGGAWRADWIFSQPRRFPGRAGLTQPGQRVQGRTVRIERVRVGMVVQQQRRQVVVAIDHRHIQRGGAIGRPVFDVRAMLQQHLGRIHMVIADGEQERGESGFGLRLDLGAEFHQHLRGGGVAFAGRPHQSRLAAEWLPGVQLSRHA